MRLQNLPHAAEVVAVNAVTAPFPPVTAAAVPDGWSSGRGVVPSLVVDISADNDNTTGDVTNVYLYAAFLEVLVYADATFTAANTDIVTLNSHGLITGDGPFRVSSSGTLPAGLAAATDYYIVWVSANTFKLASSRANAFAGTVVDITDAGTGTHTIADTASTKAVKWRKMGTLWTAPALSKREGEMVEVDHDPRAVAYGVVWTGTASSAVRAAICPRQEF